MKHRHSLEVTRSDLLKMLRGADPTARITLGYDGNTQREEVTDDNPLLVEWENPEGD